jgi:hypothetical protein
MAIHNLLAILTEVLTAHESREPDHGVTVIPILIDDFGAGADLIAGVVHGAGGIVLNASECSIDSVPATELGDLSVAVPDGRDDDVLEGIITSTLTYRGSTTAGSGVLSVEITRAGDSVDAVYSAGAAAHSDDPVLRLARAFFSPQLDSHQLAVVFYDESELDAAQSQCCWNLNGNLQDAHIGRLSTLLYVVGSEPNISRHVGPESGFEWAWYRGNKLKRDRWALRSAVTEACEDQDFMVLFLGAGFAASSGLRVGEHLRDSAIRRLIADYGTIEPSELAANFYRYLEEHGQLFDYERDPADRERLVAELTLERVLSEEYRRRDHKGLPTLEEFRPECNAALGHRGSCVTALQSMFVSSRRLVLCTVNFDELVEDGQPKVKTFATEDQFKDCRMYLTEYLAGREDLVPLLKLHGTISDIPSCVATDEVTLSGVSAAKQESLLLLSSSAVKLCPWFYVGASMRDHDLRSVFTQSGFAKNLQERWVVPFPQRSIDQFISQHRIDYWKSERAMAPKSRIVTETADTFMTALSAKWLS